MSYIIRKKIKQELKQEFQREQQEFQREQQEFQQEQQEFQQEQQEFQQELKKQSQKLIVDKMIEHTIPDIPNHPAQKFKLTVYGTLDITEVNRHQTEHSEQ